MRGFALVSADLPPARQRRSQVYRDVVSGFVASGHSSVRVELAKRADAAYSGVRLAVRDFGLEGSVRVSRRQGDLFLVRR